ncbi:hypothetical protein AB0O91_12645 [Kitasatospora sp. NPDC089797]|uniref:hypothetical protein n=1 Tax=Kitasatospora sp. NPDC089797 TaxID=3155298 RepID=UPI00343AED32
MLVSGRYVVASRLAGPPTRGRNPNAAAVVDLLWAHAITADRLDHVRVRASDTAHVLDLILLLRAATAAGAVRTAEGLFARATRSPALSDWHSGEFRALPLSALHT